MNDVIDSSQRRTDRQSVRERQAIPWSVKVARVAGIDVYLHGTFFVLIAFLALSDLMKGGVAAMLGDTLVIVALFTSVVLHELGHALMARRFGVRTHDITLFPIGGVARLDKMPDKPREQLLVAAAGPGVNVVIALLLAASLSVLGLPLGSETVRDASGSFLTQLMWINVSLAVFNLLPGYPMDGGRMLRALLAMRLEPERATQIAARVGQATAVVFAVVGLFVNPLLIVIAVFVWLGAQAEHSVSTVKVALAGRAVRDGMITDFKTVSPGDPLSRAVDLTLAGFQQDFPVVDGTRLVGLLSYDDLLRAIAEHGTLGRVGEVMRSAPETVGPADELDGAMTRMHGSSGRALTVVEDERVVGLLTSSNIGELLAMEAASRQAVVK